MCDGINGKMKENGRFGGIAIRQPGCKVRTSKRTSKTGISGMSGVWDGTNWLIPPEQWENGFEAGSIEPVWAPRDLAHGFISLLDWVQNRAFGRCVSRCGGKSIAACLCLISLRTSSFNRDGFAQGETD